MPGLNNPPPKFDSENFDLWSAEVEAWLILENVPHSGLLLWRDLPDHHPSDIKRKVNEQVGITKLAEQNGGQEFLKVMKKYFPKKDEKTAYEVYLEFFKNMKRKENETIRDFVIRFDRVSNRHLACKILDDAGLSESDRKRVISVMDFKSEDVYEHAKTGLKYLNDGSRIKLEPNGTNGLPHSESNGAKRKSPSPAPHKIDNKRIKLESSQDSHYVLMQMVKELGLLNKLAPGTSIRCKMSGCGLSVTLTQINDHFKRHIPLDPLERNGHAMGNRMKKLESTKQPILFSCSRCEKQFKLRKSLEVHVKNNHQESIPKEDSIRDRISDTDSDDESDENVSEKGAPVNEIKCQSCNKILMSERERPPVMHDCESLKKKPLPFQSVPRVGAAIKSIGITGSNDSPRLENWTDAFGGAQFNQKKKKLSGPTGQSEPSGPTGQSRPPDPSEPTGPSGQQQSKPWRYPVPDISSPKESFESEIRNILNEEMTQIDVSNALVKNELESETPEKLRAKKVIPLNDAMAKKWKCQLCSNSYSEFKAMKTHYTYSHYWSKLTEEFGTVDKECNICEKTYPSNSHLRHHMGNFHGSITVDRYLEADKCEVITREETVRLKNSSCEICKKIIKVSSSLKSHLSTKHFSRELSDEFSIGDSKNQGCPKKCGVRGDKSYLIGHVGSVHDEVLKYALPYVKMDENYRVLVDLDDFEDGVQIIENRDPQLNMPPVSCCQHEDCKYEKIDRDREQLKIHYQQDHYNEQFKINYPEKNCTFCPPGPVKFEANNLHRHIAVYHEDVLIKMLQKDELSLPSFTPKQKISPKKEIESQYCVDCSESFASKNGLKMHYYTQHFSQEFDNLYTDSKCALCEKMFSSVDQAQQHIALKHENVINGFLSSKYEGERLPWDDKKKSEKQAAVKAIHERSVFDYLASEPEGVVLPCQICTRHDFQNVAILKMHYIKDHFFDENTISGLVWPTKRYFFGDLNSGRGCMVCKTPFDPSEKDFEDGFSKHVVEMHERQLLKVMADQHLFIGKSKEFEIGETIKLKQVNIRIKNNKEAKKKNKVAHSSGDTNSTVKCDIPGCEAYFISEPKTEYYTHLMKNHFWKDLQREFGVDYMKDNERCPMCKRRNENGLELAYYTHIAVDHAHVTKYILIKLGKMEGPRLNVNAGPSTTSPEIRPSASPEMPELYPEMNTMPQLYPEIYPTPPIIKMPEIHPTPIPIPKIETKIETIDNSIVASDDEDVDDPSYVPCPEEEEIAAEESALKTNEGPVEAAKPIIVIKDIRTLQEPSLLKKPETTEEQKIDPKCKCRSCGKTFATPYKMQTHQRNCNWKCSNKQCAKVFYVQAEFSAHMKIDCKAKQEKVKTPKKDPLAAESSSKPQPSSRSSSKPPPSSSRSSSKQPQSSSRSSSKPLSSSGSSSKAPPSSRSSSKPPSSSKSNQNKSEPEKLKKDNATPSKKSYKPSNQDVLAAEDSEPELDDEAIGLLLDI